MSGKTIVQLVVFETPVRQVYDALMDSARHSAFTKDKADIDARVGGHFSTYDGYITGTFQKIVTDKQIVQRWHASDWPEDVFSKVTIDLQEKRGVTTLFFTQEGVPEQFAEAIAQGWHDYYWDRLRDYIESKL